ncbi:MAG TPA: DNA mismatch repair protein MutS [Chloroflexota bacterium]|nr:DNA mismatch repair protein MutS [Chloroflexota bacterium]
MAVTSPARRQYLDLKERHPDAILLYRLGDFYDMFDQDAVTASAVLGIQLTARSYPRGEGRVPMAGVPHHAVDSYIKRLLDAGMRVAVCEQVSEAQPAGSKAPLEREVVRVFTPGTVVEPEMLDPASNNYLAAVYPAKLGFGVAFVDVSTGEFALTQFDGPTAKPDVEAELQRLGAIEWLIPQESAQEISLIGVGQVRQSDHLFNPHGAEEKLRRRLGVQSLAGFGSDQAPLGVVAAAAIVSYLEQTNSSSLERVASLRTYSTASYMVLDGYTRASLELTHQPRERGWSLLRVLDRCKTGMGSRQLRRMIGQPLLDTAEIERRLDAVEWLAGAGPLRALLGERLARVGDLERLLGRVVQGSAKPRDLLDLAAALQAVSAIKQSLIESARTSLQPLVALADALDPCLQLQELIERSIDPDTEGGIKAGFSAELDSASAMLGEGRAAIAAFERQEVEATGIRGLKVGYNKVFGYYLEVGKSVADRVPDRYLRQQTLINAERFYTPELKELERRILGARESIEKLRKQALDDVTGRAADAREQLGHTAGAISWIDAFRSLADAAVSQEYVRPRLGTTSTLDIVDGRHPVVEAAQTDIGFVPNSIRLDEEQRIIVLTGPNMGGKSTTLRLTALIVLMAQMGSFVPASSARIGIVDRIFSRVGAQDDISAGQSTFMREMIETSNILHHATASSLLLLDEIGRGTSTYDGLAIARAVLEYIHARLRARTLFATHYHELTVLAEEFEDVKNYHMAVTEHEGRAVFLHRMEAGAADRSYGIHVARLAGLPHSVTIRAERILRQLERQANGRKESDLRQLAMFVDPDLTPRSEAEEVAVRVLDRMLALDLSNMTPLQALEELHRLQEEGRSGR